MFRDLTMTKTMSDKPEKIPAELLFLKYKGIPSPWEFIADAKRYGFKCKKYSNWSAVHVSAESRAVLKLVGDTLLDTSYFPLDCYGELSRIWEQVQRWAKDKESLLIEPDVRANFNKLLRVVNTASENPDIVDLIIVEKGYVFDELSIDSRWVLFLAICIYNFFCSDSRYKSFTDIVDEKKSSDSVGSLEFVSHVDEAVAELYSKIGFDVSASGKGDAILLLVKEIGCAYVPANTERGLMANAKCLPKIWVQRYEGSPSELVRFDSSGSEVIVRLNSLHKIFGSKTELESLLSNEVFWNLIGVSLLSHLAHLDDIQDFFDTFGKQLRLRA